MYGSLNLSVVGIAGGGGREREIVVDGGLGMFGGCSREDDIKVHGGPSRMGGSGGREGGLGRVWCG